MTTSRSAAAPRRLALLLAALLCAMVLPAVPSGAAEVKEVYYVKTVQNAQLRVEVFRDPAKGAQQPVLMTYSPYNSLYDAPLGDSYRSYVTKGFARARVDVLGTRGSDGCWDYGGLDEQQSGLDAVEWLADQPWSNGKVIMIGGSYDGTTANMVAARGQEAVDKGLVGIVPIVAISRWYGYAYSQGLRYTVQSANADPSSQGFDTPLAFDYGFAKTVAPDATQPNAAAVAVDRASECGGIDHTLHAYDESPDYTKFWDERDYLKDAEKFRVPVLLGGGWQDYNVKQEETINLFNALPVDDPATEDAEGVPFKFMFMSQGGHGTPTAIAQWSKTLNDFLDYTGKGIDNGIDQQARTAPVYTIGRTASGSGYGTTATSVEAAWPPVGTNDVRLFLRRNGGAGVVTASGKGDGQTTSYTDASAGDEYRWLRDLNRQSDFLTYVSPPLAADTRIAGEALLDAVISTNRDRGSLTPILVDIDANGARTAARGFMNLQYRGGLAKAEATPVGQSFKATAIMKPQDYTFKKGNRIGVVMAASNAGWVRPDVPALTTTVHHGPGATGTSIRLPIVNPPADPAALFQQ
jgi:X-Pro dipeptidyl-peptidase